MEYYINEILKSDLLSIIKKDAPERLRRRLDIGISSVSSVDADLLEKEGHLSIDFEVKGVTANYTVTILIENYLTQLDYFYSRVGVMHKSIEQSLRYSIPNLELRVNCTCPDFTYRYAYLATMKGYKAGSPEDRPAEITNPSSKGSACKHVARVVSNSSSWVPRVKSIVRTTVASSPNIFKDYNRGAGGVSDGSIERYEL
jgi:hypothetical protein